MMSNPVGGNLTVYYCANGQRNRLAETAVFVIEWSRV